MIVRSLSETESSDRLVKSETWESARILLSRDGMGFSFHITTIYPETETSMHYRNHLEAVYCLEGIGELEDLETGKRHEIRPGVLYALDKHDRHTMRARTRLVLACVFNPPVTGGEVHGPDGAYPAPD